MNGVTQTQSQRPKLSAGPPPVNAPPAPPPAQKPTPGHSHPSHPHPRPTQHPTAQPPPNRGQPPPNTQHPKNKKKAEPAPVDPAVMYESLKNRIAALEEEETHEEEEERKFGASLQPPCHSIPRPGKLIRRTHYVLQLRRPRSQSRAYRTTSFIQSMSNWYGHLLQACREVPF